MPDIQSIIEQMTLEEKATLCTGAGPWSTLIIERLGVPQMLVTDGPNGVRRVAELGAITSTSLPATCFPTSSCLVLMFSWVQETI